MVVFEYREIELDYCADCMGVWFDAGEIELLFQSIGLDAHGMDLKLGPPSCAVTEARRRCPLCGVLMDKVSPAGREVVLDQCKHGDGIWFDAGEIRGALSGASGTPGEETPTETALASFFKRALSSPENEDK